MSSTPFKVKAIFDYASPHEDDLSFPNGQVITVTQEEDADWYVGEYNTDSGQAKSGLFPKNFVEKYEPAIPSRPTRPSRPKETAQASPVVPASEEPEIEEPPPSLPVQLKPAPPPSEPLEETENEPEPPRETQAAEQPPPVASASKPSPAPGPSAAKGPPPPVSEKPSSFKDRIAAFNKAQTPVTPFKPSGAPAGPGGFIKKPFVAAPPSRNAYVPPPKAEPVQKVYRRDEDPEIAERQAQDHAAAETAGLVGSQHTEGEVEEEAPKPQSLKERIALLQQQQAEQAQRRAETTQKEKPKKPAKKRTQDSEGTPSTDLTREPEETVRSSEQTERTSDDGPRDLPRVAAAQLTSPPGPMSPSSLRDQDILSDGNEADQSAAGETTEANDDTSDAEDAQDRSIDREPLPAARAPAAPLREPDVGDEEDTTEGEVEAEDEEDEMDAEARRRLELRERMAKVSGGMGMAGMFGSQPGMAMPGAMQQKKAPTRSKSTRDPDVAPASPPQVPQARVPMIPVPGMQQVAIPRSEDTEVDVEKEEEPSGIVTGERGPEEVPDVDDVKHDMSIEAGSRRSTTYDRPISRAPTGDQGISRPIPGERTVPQPPASDSRPVPPPPPARAPLSPRLDDTLGAAPVPPQRPSVDTPRGPEVTLPSRPVPPPVPGSTGNDFTRSPPPPAGRRSSYFNSEASSYTSPTSPGNEKRNSRAVPPIPGVAAMGSPPLSSRAPPPPPPGAAPMTAPAAVEEPDEGSSEYEGDYDTDIASGEKHKDALKAHAREPSLDESTTADDMSARSPPGSILSPPSNQRAVPPPPPTAQPPRSRPSADIPRAAPPPVPMGSRNTRPAEDDNEAFENYSRYQSASRGVPPVPPSSAAPPPMMVGGIEQAEDSSDDYDRPPSPPRKSTDRPSHDRSVPAPPPQAAPTRPSESGGRPSRKSLDVQQTLGRRSTEAPRPPQDGFIATDVDLGDSTQWWTQPNQPPPAFQNRSDLLKEIEDSSSSKRGGKTTITRDVYVLFLDYSQTVVTARFDKNNPADVSLEQRHEAPPARLRQDQLEGFWERYGSKIATAATGIGSKKDSHIGDGSPQALAFELIKAQKDALLPIGHRAYGALVYANMANASVQQFDEIRPGDILTMRNAKLQGKHGGLHQKYSMDIGNHVAVVVEWDGTKKKVRALEQGREKKKTQVESFRLGDLKSGEARVWRVVGRDWVGWDMDGN